MKKIDILILPDHLYTLTGDGVGYMDGNGIAIDSGKIIAVQPIEILRKAYLAESVFDSPHMAALPGFIDCHMHTRHAVYRGVAQDLSRWMWEGMAPFEENSDTAS
jgi:5-methylthioadenosine/S-adenosylhomocysteine deaminase